MEENHRISSSGNDMMMIRMLDNDGDQDDCQANLLQHVHSRHMAAVKAQKSELLMQLVIVGGFDF